MPKSVLKYLLACKLSEGKCHFLLSFESGTMFVEQVTVPGHQNTFLCSKHGS